MRLLDRNDTSLAIAMVAGALVIFQRPLHFLIDIARSVEQEYSIDLIPGLTVLVGTFGFHQYRKRQQARADAMTAAAETALERERSAELERLVTFGRALGAAIDPNAVRQIFWRYLPAFAHERELWMLTRRQTSWDPVVRDAIAPSQRSVDTLEAAASAALSAKDEAQADGLVVGDDVCFPMLVGDHALGVVGVRNVPPLSPADRRALSAAVALLAIAIRNVQLVGEMRENAVRDQLTGCFNRAYALEALGLELQRAKRSGMPLSIVMFDVDRLKRTNDEHGHLTGDAMLAAIGAQLGQTLRSGDVKCRWGGDEFLVILPNTPLGGAENAGASLTREIGQLALPTSQGELAPTVSVGVAVAEPGEVDPIPLIARADAALYKAKHAGRNRFVVAQSSIRAVN